MFRQVTGRNFPSAGGERLAGTLIRFITRFDSGLRNHFHWTGIAFLGTERDALKQSPHRSWLVVDAGFSFLRIARMHPEAGENPDLRVTVLLRCQKHLQQAKTAVPQCLALLRLHVVM